MSSVSSRIDACHYREGIGQITSFEERQDVCYDQQLLHNVFLIKKNLLITKKQNMKSDTQIREDIKKEFRWKEQKRTLLSTTEKV